MHILQYMKYMKKVDEKILDSYCLQRSQSKSSITAVFPSSPPVCWGLFKVFFLGGVVPDSKKEEPAQMCEGLKLSCPLPVSRATITLREVGVAVDI